MGMLLHLYPQEIAGTEVVWEQDAEKNIVAKRGEVTGNGEMAKGEHRKRNCAPYSFMAVQLRLKRGAGHVARMTDEKRLHNFSEEVYKLWPFGTKSVDEKIILKWKSSNRF
jgi:hypothetical protein